ncbi:hypothetical protein HDE69_003033 [Pedobacter cryoconitis]|uniref:Uncharacterized protein n=2 Tax=Pedobacter cryoconitis TaxID=188932 RepID=A0A7W9DLA6_9SPHI|nr:hypothetical protein [Pedobacter cryoconitis]
MAARTFTGLLPASSYYVYARVSRSSLVGSWVISESIITAEQEAGYWNLQSGVLFPVVEGRRDHEFTKGMTFIIGDQIKAGVLMDISGLNFFNLTNSTFNLGASNNGIDYGVTLANTLTAQNIVIGYGDYVSGIGNNGSWPLYIGASSSQRPETAKFRVSRDGTMYAKEGVFEGKITAGPGSKIGDIIIDAAGKINISGTKVEIDPNAFIRVANGGGADFSDAEMSIPFKTPVTKKPGSIWLGDGATAGIPSGGGSSYFSSLLDVALTNQANGQVPMWNGTKWVNSNVVADLSALGSFAYRNTIYGNDINTSPANATVDIGVAQYMRWKNYGNGHILFDASNGTSPTGSVVDNKNSSNAWAPTFPTLMGWNGNSTYGVRVDSARIADSWNGAGAYINIDAAVNTYMMGLGYDGNWHPIGAGNLLNFLGIQAGNYLRKNVESIINAGSADNYRGNVVTFAYASSGTPYNGTLVSLGGFNDGRYDLQLNTTYWGADRLAFRNRNGDANNWNTWRSLLWNSYDETVTFTGGTGTSYNLATLQLMTATRAPNLSFHWQGVVASSISIERSGRIAIMDNPGTNYENLIANNITANGSVTSGDWFYTSGRCGLFSSTYQIGLQPLENNRWNFYTNSADNISLSLTAQGVAKGYIYGDAAGNFGFLDGAGNWALRYEKTTSHWIGSSFKTDNWFRSTGGSGWYNETYQGGIYMEDYSWVRVYNGKGLLVEGALGVQSYCFKSTGTGFKSYNHRGMIGSYDQTDAADKIIWTIGDQWNELATMYGLGYCYNNAWGEHELFMAQAGSKTVYFGLGSGSIFARGRIKASVVQALTQLIIPTSRPGSPEPGSIWIA